MSVYRELAIYLVVSFDVTVLWALLGLSIKRASRR